MKILSSTLLLFFLLAGNLHAQSWQDSIVVLPVKMQLPEGAKKLGTLKEGNNATSMNCDYEAMVTEAKQRAKAMGGNLVKITQLAEPAFISKCYSFKADVYYVASMPDYGIPHAQNNLYAASDAASATLYIYRLADTTMGTSYKVHINDDSVLCVVKGKSRASFEVSKEGEITLWAETEKRRDLKINVQHGHNYYIRCGVKSGDVRMIPVLQLVDEPTGQAEYGRLDKHKKSIGVSYLQQVH